MQSDFAERTYLIEQHRMKIVAIAHTIAANDGMGICNRRMLDELHDALADYHRDCPVEGLNRHLRMPTREAIKEEGARA